MDAFNLWLIAGSLLSSIAFFSGRHYLRHRRRARENISEGEPQPTLAIPSARVRRYRRTQGSAYTSSTRSQTASAIRVMRATTPTTTPTAMPIRVMGRSDAEISRNAQLTIPTVPPPHATCTLCLQPFSTDPAQRAARGFEHHCNKCHAYSHGDCFRIKGERCGGICSIA